MKIKVLFFGRTNENLTNLFQSFLKPAFTSPHLLINKRHAVELAKLNIAKEM